MHCFSVYLLAVCNFHIGNERMRICLTPTKNEEWVVGFTANNNHHFFDLVCYYDQLSDDNTVEMVLKIQNSFVKINDSLEFNEFDRQNSMINIARSLDCNSFFALDADEALLGNRKTFMHELAFLEPGTSVYYEVINITPDAKNFWSAGFSRFGFIDDGTPHDPTIFHSQRVPKGSCSYYSKDIKVIHFQYINRLRFCAKHLWYLELEFKLRPFQSSVDLFNNYSHMIFVKTEPLENLAGLPAFVDLFLSSYLPDKTPTIINILDNKFVRKLCADDEWLLLHLIRALYRFAGYEIDVYPRITTFRKITIFLLESGFLRRNKLFARLIFRIIKLFIDKK